MFSNKNELTLKKIKVVEVCLAYIDQIIASEVVRATFLRPFGVPLPGEEQLLLHCSKYITLAYMEMHR